MDLCYNQYDIVAYALYIAYMCRNQVLHSVAENILFYRDGEMTEKIIGVLIGAIYFTTLLP
ncbi:hypothetical protein EDB95_1482 [Dinghuibacter silviterrae]|uniref:Uncharacterized protein n=1 Tax=Dinghuibacter silviterrae TaxID=1539049 RepID=A0A4R8DST3_9BACT|nr:hypothetical protein EDB95_1482 [Dinghuibacter silviterrae]